MKKYTDEEILAAVKEHGSNNKAAKALGMGRRTIDRRVQKLVLKGYSPAHDMVHMCPDGYKVKGVSTLYKPDGSVSAQWVKTSADHDRRMEMLNEAVMAALEPIVPEHPRKAPAHTASDLLNMYVITDYHLGAKAWGEETGADWDLAIAEELIVKWFAAAIAMSPDSKVGVFAQLGDFMHWDGMAAVTPTSGHTLDADSRFQKLVRVAIKVIRRVTGMLLDKHETVHLIMAEGNHDLASSAWLREMFSALYAHEPRVLVDTRPDPYYCVEHGLTSIFIHHGHKKKFEALETVFISKFREVFGRTQFSFAHTGHLHHDIIKETNTMKLEQHRTLAAPDSHASRGGWMSGRDAKVITYHKKYGEVCRNTVCVDMLN